MKINPQGKGIMSFRNKYLALAIIFLFSFFSSSAQKFDQTFSKTYGYDFQRGNFLKVLLFPTGCNAPALLSATDSARLQAALYYDSCNNKVYIYSPKSKTWAFLSAGGSGGGIQQFIAGFGLMQINDSSAMVDTSVIASRWAIDSLSIVKINKADSAAGYVTPSRLKDTAAVLRALIAASGGSPNTSVGSGIKIAINGTNNIKSVTAGYGAIWDSATTNQVNIKIDTANKIASRLQAQHLIDSLAARQNKTNYYGSIYKAYSWSNLSDFVNSGATVSATGGKLVFTGGASNFTQSLNININQTKNITPYYTNLERWRFKMHFEIVSTGIVGIGTRATTINSSSAGAFAFINTASGASTFKANSATNLTCSVGDSIEIIAEKNGFNTMIQVRNLTTNSATITTYGQYLISDGDVPVTGQFAVFNYSGSFNTTSLEIDSKAPLYADVIHVGTSKTQGYNTTYLQRYGTLNSNYYNVIVHGGGFETTADWETSIQEVIALHPVAVTLENPCNDLRTGVNVDSTKARYYRIEKSFRDAGIEVYHLNGLYENNIYNPTAWVAYISSTRSVDSVIDVYTPTSTTAGYLAADNVHPSVFGMTLISNTILSSNKLKGTIIPALAPGNFIAKQTTTEQANAGFNIGGAPSILRSTLNLGNSVASDVQLRIKTGTDLNLEMYSDGSNNYIYSLNDARNTAKPLYQIGSQITLNSGGQATAVLDANQKTTLFGALETGTGKDLVGTVANRFRLANDYEIHLFNAGDNYMDSYNAARTTYRNLNIRGADITLQNNGATTVTLSGGKVGIGATPASTLDVTGSLATSYVAKTTTYTATATDQVISCSGTFTLTLPTAVGITGRIYTIKNTGTGIITIATTSSQTIDGSTTLAGAIQNETYYLKSNGSNWEVN